MTNRGMVVAGVFFFVGCVPKECDGPDPTSDASLASVALREIRTELTSLAELQEIYFADHTGYASDLKVLIVPTAMNHPGVAVRLLSAGAEGWAAEATHRALPASEGCVLVHGNPPGYEPGIVVSRMADEVTCTDAFLGIPRG